MFVKRVGWWHAVRADLTPIAIWPAGAFHPDQISLVCEANPSNKVSR